MLVNLHEQLTYFTMHNDSSERKNKSAHSNVSVFLLQTHVEETNEPIILQLTRRELYIEALIVFDRWKFSPFFTPGGCSGY